MISARTTAALAAARARGVRLGRPENLTPDARLSGSAAGNVEKRKRAMERIALVMPVVREIQAAGVTSMRGIARSLNQRDVPTPVEPALGVKAEQ